MKKIIYTSIIAILTITFCFGVASFISWGKNPKLWQDEERFIFAFITLCFTAATTLIFINEYNDKQ